MEKHVYFVRHGQSETNLDHIGRGDQAALTETGHAQAKVVAERVAKLKVTHLIASTFVRAQETAQAISTETGLPIETTTLFGEWGEPSAYTGRHDSDPEFLKAFVAIHTKTDPHYRYDDEETFAEFKQRAEDALAFLESYPGERICVVSHFGFLQMLAAVILLGDAVTPQMQSRLFNKLRHRNTGLTYFKYAPSRSATPEWQVITWNDQSHFG